MSPDNERMKDSSNSPSDTNTVIKIEIVEGRTNKAKTLTDRIFNELDRQLFGATFNELLSKMPQGELSLLAKTKEGKLVGTTYITFSGGLGEIHSLVVDPAYQQQGVGTALIRKAETFAATHNLHTISLTAPTNLKGALIFYEKLGFKRAACIPNGRLGFDWIIFTKQLCQPKYPWLKS